MTLLVLAAGMGSRYGGLKQLDPMTKHGEFMIDFSVYDAIRAGYNKIVFVIKRENYTLFRTTIGKRLEKVIAVEYVFQDMQIPDIGVSLPPERIKPLGTAHALLCAKNTIQERFSVINADDYYGPTAYQIAADYLAKFHEYGHFCMVGYELKNTLTDHGTVSRGICTANKNGMLTDITERTKIRHAENRTHAEFFDGIIWTPLSYQSIASMNFFGLDPSIFDFADAGFRHFLKSPETDLLKGEYFLPSVVSQMNGKGKCDLKILKTIDQWHGVTYPEDKQEVVSCIKDMICQGIYPDGLWKE